jgi:PAS domain S-box-containing protein
MGLLIWPDEKVAHSMTGKAPRTRGAKKTKRSADGIKPGGPPSTMLQNLPAALYRCRADEEMTLVFVSPGIEAICGLTPEDLCAPGKASRLSLTHPDERIELLRRWRIAKEGRSPFRHVYRIQRPDGDLRWIEDRATLIEENGEAFFDGLMLDVTQSKHHEQALVGAKMKADEASQAKSAFLATMSHEIRTPLNGMIGMAALLAKTDTSPRQRQFIDLLSSSAEALLTLVNDILDFSKIEAGHLELEDTDYDPTALVCRAVEMLAPRAHAKNIEIGAYVDPKLPGHLHGDPGRLRQILLNLAGNAIKFTEHGGIAVELLTHRAGKGKELLVLRVRDTGIGIAPGDVPRLFRRFAQLDSSANRRYGGTGLGLSICKELVELMGGDIAVESVLDNGSLFEVRLPLATADAKKTRKRIKIGTGRTAIVADGNPVSREVLTHNLSSAGFAVETVDSAAALQGWLADQGPTMTEGLIVISDNLEDRLAIDFARALRNDGTFAAASLVLCATGPAELDREAAKVSPFDGHLVKPVTPASVAACLTALQPAAAASETPSSRIEQPRDDTGGQGLKVLIVEDNEINQLLTVNMLESEGIASKVAANGKEALKILAAESFDLVLMDIQMPVMDGFEATREVRKLPSPISDIPIIALTANAISGDRERCLEGGMNDYIAKPIEPTHMAEKIRDWCGRSAKREGAEPLKALIGILDDLAQRSSNA